MVCSNLNFIFNSLVTWPYQLLQLVSGWTGDGFEQVLCRSRVQSSNLVCRNHLRCFFHGLEFHESSWNILKLGCGMFLNIQVFNSNQDWVADLQRLHCWVPRVATSHHHLHLMEQVEGIWTPSQRCGQGDICAGAGHVTGKVWRSCLAKSFKWRGEELDLWVWD